MPNVSSEEIPRNIEEIQIDILQNPVFVYVGHILDKRMYHFPLHKHDNITEILYIVEGESSFLIDNMNYFAQAGDLVLFNSGVMHEEFHALKNNIDAYYCAISNIQFKSFKALWLMPANANPILHTNQYQKQIKYLFEELYTEGCARKAGYSSICNNLVTIISVLIIRIVNEQIHILNNVSHLNPTLLQVEAIKDYLNANFTCSLTIEKIADHFHLSPSYISHLFKKIMGLSLMKYHNKQRMDEAKRLLMSTNMSIREIALTIGFQNPNYFYLPFKKHTGLTPQEYREKTNSSIIRFPHK